MPETAGRPSSACARSAQVRAIDVRSIIRASSHKGGAAGLFFRIVNHLQNLCLGLPIEARLNGFNASRVPIERKLELAMLIACAVDAPPAVGWVWPSEHRRYSAAMWVAGRLGQRRSGFIRLSHSRSPKTRTPNILAVVRLYFIEVSHLICLLLERCTLGNTRQGPWYVDSTRNDMNMRPSCSHT